MENEIKDDKEYDPRNIEFTLDDEINNDQTVSENTIDTNNEKVSTENTLNEDINNQESNLKNEAGESINNQQFEPENTMDSDEILIRSYIGKNVEKIYYNKLGKTNFSINWVSGILGQLIGPVWFFYRKSYLYGILAIVASIITANLCMLIGYKQAYFIIGIIYFLYSNQIYIYDAKKKIEKIKNENRDKSFDELKEIVSKKGGTNIIAASIYVLCLTIIITISLILVFAFGSKIPMKNIKKEVTNITESIKQEPYTTKEGYKRVGKDGYGYFDVPNGFVNFKEIDDTSGTLMQYSKPDKSFIITVQHFAKEKVTYNDAVINMISNLKNDGPSIVTTKTKINGCNATILFQYYEDEKLKFYVYLIDEPESVKYIAIEYAGEQESIKNDIINSYRISDDSNNISVNKTSQENKNQTSSNQYNSPLIEYYNKINIGDSYEQIKEKLGSEGEQKFEDGYYWYFGDKTKSSYIFAVIFKDKLYSKQLRFDMDKYSEIKDSKVNLSSANDISKQINNGTNFTYNQLVEKFGTSGIQIETDKNNNTTYLWVDKNEGYVNASFKPDGSIFTFNGYTD